MISKWPSLHTLELLCLVGQHMLLQQFYYHSKDLLESCKSFEARKLRNTYETLSYTTECWNCYKYATSTYFQLTGEMKRSIVYHCWSPKPVKGTVRLSSWSLKIIIIIFLFLSLLLLLILYLNHLSPVEQDTHKYVGCGRFSVLPVKQIFYNTTF